MHTHTHTHTRGEGLIKTNLDKVDPFLPCYTHLVSSLLPHPEQRGRERERERERKRKRQRDKEVKMCCIRVAYPIFFFFWLFIIKTFVRVGFSLGRKRMGIVRKCKRISFFPHHVMSTTWPFSSFSKATSLFFLEEIWKVHWVCLKANYSSSLRIYIQINERWRFSFLP